MSGHSKWATIKHKKGAADAKRGALFTKLTREIITAAKEGGGNPDTNFRLRAAMNKAKSMNMPSNNIENAIKKGTGELPGVVYESVVFDAYAPGGVALLIEGLTDNKNRTTAEVRSILGKKNGSLAGPGATAYLFTKKGLIAVEKDKVSEEDLMDIVLEAGAEDINAEGEVYEITCEPTDTEAIKEALAAKNIEPKVAELTAIPSSTVKVTGGDVKAVLGVMEALEDHEDVQAVYANFDISDEDMDAAAGE